MDVLTALDLLTLHLQVVFRFRHAFQTNWVPCLAKQRTDRAPRTFRAVLRAGEEPEAAYGDRPLFLPSAFTQGRTQSRPSSLRSCRRGCG